MDKNRILLKDLKKQVPMAVPEGFFEELPNVIQGRVEGKDNGNSEARSDRDSGRVIGVNWQWGLGSAAAVLLVAVLIWVTFPKQQGALGSEPLSGISQGSIIEYLEEENLSYFDLSEQRVVQAAFESDSTVMYYLEGMDDELLLQQLMETTAIDLEKI
ncbi:hypothetical protein [Dyadobacter jejuensis]|nr:hypothetical protein [Dyadobacter jejuensis]